MLHSIHLKGILSNASLKNEFQYLKKLITLYGNVSNIAGTSRKSLIIRNIFLL